MRLTIKAAAILAFLSAPITVWAQGAVQQSGPVAAGHLACWGYNGIIFDCGPPSTIQSTQPITATGTAITNMLGVWVSYLAGIANPNPILIQPPTTMATDAPDLSIIRTTTHTGGTPGFVESGLRIATTVGAGVTDFEWGGLSVLNNHATAGENVAFYHQANKYSTGPTWAGVSECNDFNNAVSSVAGSLPCTEIDVNSSGLDDFGTVGLRGGIDIIPGRAAGASGTSEIGWGARVNVGANAVVRRGFYVAGAFDQAAFDASLGAAGSRGGITAAAFRGTAGQLWDFAGDSSYYLWLNGTTLQWQHSGVTLFSLDNTGALGLAGSINAVANITATGFVKGGTLVSTGTSDLNADSALSTSATAGFVGLPFTSGAPTGAPLLQTNCAINTSSGTLNCYWSGAWHHIAFSSGAG